MNEKPGAGFLLRPRTMVLLVLLMMAGITATVSFLTRPPTRATPDFHTRACINQMAQVQAAIWAARRADPRLAPTRVSQLVTNYLASEPRCPLNGAEYKILFQGTNYGVYCPNFEPNSHAARLP